MSRVVATMVLAAAVFAAPVPSQGQVGVSVMPRFGTMSFGDEIYRTTILGSDETSAGYAVAEPVRTLGLGVEVGNIVDGLTLVASLDHSVDLDTTIRLGGAPNRPCQLSCGWGRLLTDVPSSITHVGVDALLPFQLEIGPIGAYATVGMGIARYRFAPPRQAREERNALLPRSGLSSSIRVGGGVRASLLGAEMSLTLLDAMNRYWDETRHHRMTTLGVSLPL